MKSLLSLAAPFILIAACQVGCQPDDPAATYEREPTVPAGPQFDAAAFRAQLDHTLAAIIPQGEQVWFLKLDLPASAVETLRKPFLKVLGSIDFVEGKDVPQWQLPEGWEELPGDQIAAAKATATHDGQTYTMTLTALPGGERREAMLAQNVNRWLGQLGQGPLPVEEAVALARTHPTVDGEATWFELIGRRPSRGGMPADHPPVATDASEPAPVERGATSAPAEAASKPAAADGFKYDAPDGWVLGQPQPNRKATWQIPGEDAPAELRVSAWPGERGRGMGSLSMNLMRWSGMVGLPTEPAAIEQLEASAADIQVGGAQGQYVELLPPEATESSRGMLAALVYRPQEVWFFVMSGAADTLQAKRAELKQFLTTVQFTD